jgi:hypothetical protein
LTADGGEDAGSVVFPLGYQNAAVGAHALQSLTTGTENTAAGYATLNGNTTGTFVSSSDRAAKPDIRPPDADSMLARVAALPLAEWSYRDDPGVRHAGPMAQDFHAAFGLGGDDRHIAMVDADGVALAAIQALHKMVLTRLEEQQAEIARSRAEVAELRTARRR